MSLCESCGTKLGLCARCGDEASPVALVGGVHVPLCKLCLDEWDASVKAHASHAVLYSPVKGSIHDSGYKLDDESRKSHQGLLRDHAIAWLSQHKAR